MRRSWPTNNEAASKILGVATNCGNSGKGEFAKMRKGRMVKLKKNQPLLLNMTDAYSLDKGCWTKDQSNCPAPDFNKTVHHSCREGWDV